MIAPLNTSPLPAAGEVPEKEPPFAPGEGWGGVADLSNLALALALGAFDEHYAPVQRLALITAIDIYIMALGGSQDACLTASAAAFWGYISAGDYPAAYAEAISAQRV